ncbi:hypothetical protein JAAARDRAFT_716425, partial [Jaapia argillacea MUCL 33604]
MLRNSDKVLGYRIPGLAKQLLISLFADDATVFLTVEDRYHDLRDILDKWCRAAGAKCNISKTEIIPIGTREHRLRVVSTRKIHPDDPPLDVGVRIAKDGDPVRSLGAWIGNDVDNTTPWEPIVDKIQTNLRRWAMGHPTLDGKKLIIQMIVGGMTQYLTKVQGMPKGIETALIGIVRKFLWGDARTPPIALEYLYGMKEDGGID